MLTLGLPWWLRLWRICLQWRRPRFNPWIGKIPWRREWLATSVFLSGKFHGQRSLEGYGPLSRKESDTTEWLTLSLFTSFTFMKGGRRSMGNMSQTWLTFFLEHLSLILFEASTLSYEILQDGMYGRMKGWSREGGAFSPKALSYRHPFSTETGVVQWGPKSRPQIRIPSPGSGGLSSPGSTRNRGPRNSDTKSRGAGSQLAGAAKAQGHCCCRCGFSSPGMIYASGWTFFFFLSPSLLFWILLWIFFFSLAFSWVSAALIFDLLLTVLTA